MTDKYMDQVFFFPILWYKKIEKKFNKIANLVKFTS
jgi:hypothetical protein